APGFSDACGRSYMCIRSTITSEAQRSFVGLTGYFEARVAALMRTALSCFFCMSSGRLQGDAFLRVELDVDGIPDGRAQRRMLARKQRAAAELHLEIDDLAEEDLLVDRALPDVARLSGLRLLQRHVLGPHRHEHLVLRGEPLGREHREVPDLRAHAIQPVAAVGAEHRAVAEIR